MAQQPDLFPPNPPQANPSDGTGARARVPLLRRLEVLVRVLVRLYLGLLVLVLPWLSFWTQNNLFTYSPALLELAGSGFFRGVISGIGLLDIVFAVLEAKNAPEFS